MSKINILKPVFITKATPVVTGVLCALHTAFNTQAFQTVEENIKGGFIVGSTMLVETWCVGMALGLVAGIGMNAVLTAEARKNREQPPREREAFRIMDTGFPVGFILGAILTVASSYSAVQDVVIKGITQRPAQTQMLTPSN